MINILRTNRKNRLQNDPYGKDPSHVYQKKNLVGYTNLTNTLFKDITGNGI